MSTVYFAGVAFLSVAVACGYPLYKAWRAANLNLWQKTADLVGINLESCPPLLAPREFLRRGLCFCLKK